MAENSNIEWTDATWNPWHGCHKVSQGCKNCYMFRDKARFGHDPNIVVRSSDKTFYAPLKWKEPRRIFTCSWSDFFIEESDPWRDEAFAIVALTPQHVFQVLTKRPERMLEYFNNPRIKQDMYDAIHYGDSDQLEWRSHELYIKIEHRKQWPLPNVWLGVSVEDQKTADERIPLLLQTPAAVRFLSIEPLLGPVDAIEFIRTGIDWVIVGGESGPNARPMHPDWVRSIRDQCVAADVPFFFKQGSQANWPKFKDFDEFPADLQIREMPNER